MSPEEFAARFAVSRETQVKLDAFAAILLRWNARINLIGRSTESQLWIRHMADSAQLWALRPKSVTHWVDMGAGAGFPGLVIAAFAQSEAPDVRITLVESDARKCAFLAEAARAMDVQPFIRAERIEAIPPLKADVLSARALAPLESLLEYVTKHRRPDGIGLFPKGEAVHKEIEAAAGRWRFEYRIHPSVTESQGAIVEVGAVSSV